MLVAAIGPKEQFHGMLLLACVISLGLLGIGVIVALGVARRRHWQRLEDRAKRDCAPPAVDPWTEAGRRMAVPQAPHAGETEGSGEDDLTRP